MNKQEIDRLWNTYSDQSSIVDLMNYDEFVQAAAEIQGLAQADLEAYQGIAVELAQARAEITALKQAAAEIRRQALEQAASLAEYYVSATRAAEAIRALAQSTGRGIDDAN